MSDLTPLNDPELQQLEHSLQSLKLKPAASQQEQYLYQCGRAAGRAELKKQLWISSTFMGMFALSTFCLCLMIWNQPMQQNSPDEPIVAIPDTDVLEPPLKTPAQGILRVSSNLDDLLATQDSDQTQHTSNNNHARPNHIMTTRSWPELLDN